jgi:hypothetical protein
MILRLECPRFEDGGIWFGVQPCGTPIKAAGMEPSVK